MLIRFDKFVEGRAYQGMTELSVRPGSPVLNEATALSLTAESGQATQRYSYATYSVNGGATQTRLLLGHPDDGYANSLFDDPGVLYKADANSSFTYQGDDQTTYADQFTQVNGQGSQDLQPIISFLKWMDGASDDEFAAHLSDHVDVESFARYVATQNLLVNSDDMAGPGRNYYLWYDLGTRSSRWSRGISTSRCRRTPLPDPMIRSAWEAGGTPRCRDHRCSDRRHRR